MGKLLTTLLNALPNAVLEVNSLLNEQHNLAFMHHILHHVIRLLYMFLMNTLDRKLKLYCIFIDV